MYPLRRSADRSAKLDAGVPVWPHLACGSRRLRSGRGVLNCCRFGSVHRLAKRGKLPPRIQRHWCKNHLTIDNRQLAMSGPIRNQGCVKTPVRGCAARCAVVAPPHRKLTSQPFWGYAPNLGRSPRFNQISSEGTALPHIGRHSREREFPHSLYRGRY